MSKKDGCAEQLLLQHVIFEIKHELIYLVEEVINFRKRSSEKKRMDYLLILFHAQFLILYRLGMKHIT